MRPFQATSGYPQVGGLPAVFAYCRAGCFHYFVFLKRRECIRGHFLVAFGIRSGPSQGFSRIRRGIRRHPRVRWQICESKWLVFRTLPCDVAALVFGLVFFLDLLDRQTTASRCFNSFGCLFQCKDRASDRDRPQQRK